MRYAYKKSCAWNGDLAYFCGLMASDGCLIKDGRHMVMTSKDMEIIQHVQAVTNTRTKIAAKTGQFGTSAYHFQFSNVALYDFLLNAGITPAKSHTI